MDTISKLLNFRVLLFVFAFVFTRQISFASTDYWMYLHIQVDCYPTGSGLVYANNKQSVASNTNNCTTPPLISYFSTAESYVKNGNSAWYVNTKPTDVTKWEFVGWVKDANENTDFYNTNYVSTDKNPDTSFKDPGSYASSTADGHGGKVNHDGNDPYYLPDPFPITLRMTAVYRSIEPDVVAVANNGSLGAVDIADAQNNVGDDVTLTAIPTHYNSKFEGWYKDGVLVTKDNPYTFRITNENKGTYTAKFEVHKFKRIKNADTQRYINAIGDEGSMTDFSSLSLENDGTATRYEAGTVFYLWDYDRTNPTAHPYVFDVQGFSSTAYYDDTKGIYVTILHENETDTWTISDKDKSLFMADKGGAAVGMAAKNAGFPIKWVYEHIDNNLETKENYFSLDPAKLVQVGDKYYTTLRTSWNILFNPEQMTPYIVSSYDDTAGTFEMEPLTGNIIPAGTPVVIETSSADVEENRMVPTTTAAASGAVPSGNQLVCSTKYFPNQSAPTSPCKGLTVSNGKLTFGGSNLSTVNGNEAYLPVASDVSLEPEIPEVTLAELLASGDTENTYIVTDLTAVRLVDNNQLLFAKDNNGYPEDNKDENTGSDADYMQYASGLQHPMGLRAYDQSNWIALRVPAGDNISASVLGKHLTGVKGRLLSTVNPEFQLDVAPGSDDATAANVTPNTFVAASFQGSQDGFFFVQPKPMEIAYVEWAQWNGTKFIAPVHDENHPDWNQAELTGEFELNGAYLESQNENGGSLDMSTLVSGHVYAMEPAVIKVKTGDYNHVYVLGNVNGTAWSTNNGVEMNTNDGTTYTAIVTVNKADANNNNGYFSFTKKLGATWEAIKDYRIGAIADGNNYTITSTLLGQELPLIGTYGSGTKSFEIANGRYLLTLNLSTMKLVVTSVPAQAPRREDAAQQYVVYPVTMTKITAENENGVVTGVSTVGANRVAVGTQYINVAGVRSSQPWNGVNIVVTTFSDGTTTATKQLH